MIQKAEYLQLYPESLVEEFGLLSVGTRSHDRLFIRLESKPSFAHDIWSRVLFIGSDSPQMIVARRLTTNTTISNKCLVVEEVEAEYDVFSQGDESETTWTCPERYLLPWEVLRPLTLKEINTTAHELEIAANYCSPGFLLTLVRRFRKLRRSQIAQIWPVLSQSTRIAINDVIASTK